MKKISFNESKQTCTEIFTKSNFYFCITMAHVLIYVLCITTISCVLAKNLNQNSTNFEVQSFLKLIDDPSSINERMKVYTFGDRICGKQNVLLHFNKTITNNIRL